MNEALLNILVKAQAAVRSERGQTTMEWIGIAVGLIVIVGLLFAFFGRQLREVGCDVMNDIFKTSISTCEGAATPD